MPKFKGASGMILFLLLISGQMMDANALYNWIWKAGTSEKQSSTYTPERAERQGEVLGSTKRTGPPPWGSPFDIDTSVVLGSQGRGKELYESASGNVCWRMAYSGLAKSCRDILKDETQKCRLALRLTDCFMKASGRGGLKCTASAPVASCVKKFDDHTHSIFLAFYIDASAMCHYLQSQEFKTETENLVNDLKLSAEAAESSLDAMNKEMDLRHAVVIERAENILEVQKQLQKEHDLLQANIEKGMDGIHEAAEEAQQQLHVINKYQSAILDAQQELAKGLAAELYELQIKSNTVGESMTNLHGLVEDLTDKSAIGQEQAMKGLSELQNLQLDAMQESRQSMNKLAEEAQQHQGEFRDWQKELGQMHQKLLTGSASIVKAQESFVERQAEVFSTIEKMFSLHNALLMESRAVKTLVLYFAISVLIFMATTAKRTRNARLLLYSGLFVTMTLEVWLIRFRGDDLNTHGRFKWPPRKIVWVRYTYAALSMIYLIVTALRFKDFEVLSYQMLKDIHGRIGKHARFQEKLLVDHLGRCETCKDCSRSPKSRATRKHQSETAISEWPRANSKYQSEANLNGQNEEANRALGDGELKNSSKKYRTRSSTKCSESASSATRSSSRRRCTKACCPC